jgi:hypothetical protein
VQLILVDQLTIGPGLGAMKVTVYIFQSRVMLLTSMISRLLMRLVETLSDISTLRRHWKRLTITSNVAHAYTHWHSLHSSHHQLLPLYPAVHGVLTVLRWHSYSNTSHGMWCLSTILGLKQINHSLSLLQSPAAPAALSDCIAQ